MLIAQITDLHIVEPDGKLFGSIDTAARLAFVVAYINNLEPRPDVVLCTGDLTETGTADACANLRMILGELRTPYYLIPGNHDNVTTLRAVFDDHRYLPAQGFLHYVVDHFPVKLIGLDTTVPDAPHGMICGERVAWLEQTLAAKPAQPTLIFMHHPPFMTGVEAFDTIACRGADRLGSTLSDHPQVELIIAGHHHQAYITRWRGIISLIAPPLAHQAIIGPNGMLEHAWALPPPAFLLHDWRRGAGFMTRPVSLLSGMSDAHLYQYIESPSSQP